MSKFNTKNIMVIGDVMIDEYWSGNIERISPEAPVPIVDIATTSFLPGGAANVALNVSSLGIKTTIVGVVGDDIYRTQLEKALNNKNIKTIFNISKKVNTIRKLRVIGNNNQILRLDFESKKEDYKLDLNSKIFDMIKSSSVVILSDYNKGSLLDIKKIISKCIQCNKAIIIDPKGNDFFKYKNATIITPNLKEFEQIVGQVENESELLEKGLALREDLNLEALLITRGKDGMTLITNDNFFKFDAISQDVYDVTGAGDTVVAVLSACIGCGYDLENSVRIANIAASKVVQKQGTASIQISEIEEYLTI